MSDWQPIETAPKDGTRVLLFERGRIGEISSGRWKPLRYAWYIDGWPAHPTHWQPLPEPPETV